MVDIEGGSRPKGPEFKIIIPSLPTLYDGVFEEVHAEAEADSQAFIIATSYKMSIDNPGLEEVLQDENGILPQYSLKLAAIYYEMFARSARKNGLPMMGISLEKFKASNKMDTLKLVRGLQDIETLHEVIRAEMEVAKTRKEKDHSFSPELVKFWKDVDDNYGDFTYDLNAAERLLSEFTPLHVMQATLQRQADEYSLAAQDIYGLI